MKIYDAVRLFYEAAMKPRGSARRSEQREAPSTCSFDLVDTHVFATIASHVSQDDILRLSVLQRGMTPLKHHVAASLAGGQPPRSSRAAAAAIDNARRARQNFHRAKQEFCREVSQRARGLSLGAQHADMQELDYVERMVPVRLDICTDVKTSRQQILDALANAPLWP